MMNQQEEINNEQEINPSERDLKDFSSKLQEEMLKSEDTIKIAKIIQTPNISKKKEAMLSNSVTP